MKALIHLMIIVLALASFSGCRKHSAAWPQMDIAESVMEESPDSAMSVLAQIDADRLTSAEEHARFALLLSEALVKQGYLLTDDSIARVALDYYEKKTGSEGLMKALFFNADIADTNKKYEDALQMLLEAKEIAHKKDNYYWYAKIVELIGDIFSKTYHYEELVGCSFEAADYYKRAGKERNHRFTLVDYANALSKTGKDSVGLSLIDSIINLSTVVTNDTMLMAYCEKNKFSILVEIGKYSQAKDLYEKTSHIDLENVLNTPNEHAYLATVLVNTGNIEEALYHANVADSLINEDQDKITLYWMWWNYYKGIGILSKAKTYADSIMVCQNKELTRFMEESIIKSQRDYYSLKADKEKERASKMSIIVYISLFVVLLLCSIGWIGHCLRVKAKNAEVDARIQDVIILTQTVSQKTAYGDTLIKQIAEKENEICELKSQISMFEKEVDMLKGIVEKTQTTMFSQIETKEKDINCMLGKIEFAEKEIDALKLELTKNQEILRGEMAGVFKDGWRLLNKLCNEYFEKGLSETTRLSLLKDIDSEINKMRDNKNLAVIELSVNKYMDGIVDKMKNECRFFKPEDVTFLTLVAAGFSPRAICLLRNLKLKNFYMKKKRLLSRIEDSCVPSKDAILKWLL